MNQETNDENFELGIKILAMQEERKTLLEKIKEMKKEAQKETKV